MTSLIRNFAGAVIAGTTFALTAGVPATLYADEPTVLRFGSFVAPGSVNNSVSIPAFISAVEEASEGTLKIEHYPGGTLGSSPAQQLQLVEEGVIDIAEVVAAATPGRFPDLELFELPFLFETSLEAGLTAWEMYERGHLRGFDDLVLIGIIEVGPYTLHGRRAMDGPSDLRGMRLRSGGAIQTEIINRLGAVPVGGLAATAIAENISRRVLDGTLMDDGNLMNFRIADAARHHVTNVQLGHVAVIFPMRRSTYDALPEKARAALDQYRGAWFTEVLNSNLDGQIERVRSELEANDDHMVVQWSEDDIAATRALMDGIESEWDRENAAGVNLYREMLAIRDDLRAQAAQ